MAARRCRAVPALLAVVARLVAAGEPGASGSARTVGALVGVLLCLAVGLALAWRHLCRLSPGRYHPRPLGRRVVARLRGQWHRLRGHGDTTTSHHGDPSPTHHGDATTSHHGDPTMSHREDTVVAPRAEEEELLPWSREQRPKEEKEEEDGKEEEEEEVMGRPPSGGQVGGASAEALLSDLHAFSGTAAWGDARPQLTAL